MLIQKDGITRNIRDSSLWEYQEKGYVVVKKGKTGGEPHASETKKAAWNK